MKEQDIDTIILHAKTKHIIREGEKKISILIEDHFKELNPLICSLPEPSSLNFRKFRKNAKLTLREVEEKTSISNAYLSQLENGLVKNPSYEIVYKLITLYKSFLK